MGDWRVKADVAQREVFFEAVELKEVGEFKGPDVASAFADFLLKIADESGDVFVAVTAAK